MTVQASSAQLSTEELKHIEEAQKTDEGLQKVFSQSEEQLQRKKLRISPQGILYRVEGDRWLMVVPKVLQQKIIRENCGILAIRHVGLNRTMDHIKRAFWWRGMWSTVGEYVRFCPICQLVKSDHRKKAGILQPIPLPERKWQQIMTDLVIDLPQSNGKTAIAVFVDRLSKMVHFALCPKEISAEKYAQLFINHVLKQRGQPEVIISDRDPRFTSSFWKELFQKLRTDLRFSTAFHLQTGGQSEVMIRVLENFLRPYVERNPHTWVQQLPLAKFAVNNAVSISSGFTPFYLNTSAHLTTPVSMLYGGTSKGSQNEVVKETLERMKTALAKAQTNLERAQCKMAKAINRSRRLEQYNIGDEMVLNMTDLRNYCPHLLAKLWVRWVGPFTISRVVSPVAYKVDLPPGW